MTNYLIWSNEHRAWWRTGHRGYTTNLFEAGHYTREQAIVICRNAGFPFKTSVGPDEIPVCADDVKELLA